MTDKEIAQLRLWATRYHCADFISADPVQFPHRYVRTEDIEISGLLTALLSFGNRTQILKKANQLDDMMHHAPLEYVLSGKWREDFPATEAGSFYRMVSYASFRTYFERLYRVYAEGQTLEDCLMHYRGTPIQKLCAFLDVSDRSPQKKLNMFLRWMIRRESEVDFGIWKQMSPADLLVPLDTHVCRMAYQLGLIDRPTYSLAAAKRITEALAQIFPGDPCLGDFALFGYGVTHPDE